MARTALQCEAQLGIELNAGKEEVDRGKYVLLGFGFAMQHGDLGHREGPHLGVDLDVGKEEVNRVNLSAA